MCEMCDHFILFINEFIFIHMRQHTQAVVQKQLVTQMRTGQTKTIQFGIAYLAWPKTYEPSCRAAPCLMLFMHGQ